MRLLEKIGSLFSFIPLALTLVAGSLAIAPQGAAAGPIPATQLQFPVFYLTSGPVTTASSSETNLYQVAIPNNVLGNNGILTVTAGYQKQTLTNTETLKFYIGGTGNPPTGGTCINTNSLVASAHGLFQFFLVVTNLSGGTAGVITNTVVGQTTTNTFNGSTFVFNPVFDTRTNVLNFTITGTGDGTNTIGLDFLKAEFLSMQ